MRNVKTTHAFRLALIAILVAAVYCGSHKDDNAALDGGSGGYGSGGDDAGDDTCCDDTADDTGSDDDSLVPIPTVAIIHHANAARMAQWAAVLDSYGYPSFGIDEADLPGANFTGADVVLVDTQTLWYTVEGASAVDDTGLPILGLGPGGMHLYDQLGLQSGFSHTDDLVFFTQQSITIRASGSPVFKTPRNFALENGDIMRILEYGQDLYAISIDPAPAGVTVLAAMDDNPSRSSVLLENNRFMSWGFDLSASDLNQDGRDFLGNCIAFLGGL